MSIDLYIIGSPLQALNAVEARAVFPVEHAIAVLVESVSSASNAQIRSILESENWRGIRTVAIHAGRFRKRYCNVEGIVASLGMIHIGRLFIGFYDDIFLHFTHSLAHSQLFLLDDGVATISLNYARIRNCNDILPVPAWKQIARKYFLQVVDGMRAGPIDTVRYFTIYEGLTQDSRNLVQTHTMERLRSRRAMTSQNDEVWLLGLGSERIFKHQELYVAAIERIVRSWSPAPVRYLPHRFESPRQLELIRRRTGAEILQTGMPVELYLAESHTVPAAVCSLVSSALYTVGVLFPNTIQIVSYRMKFQQIRRRYHRQFGLIYHYYERTPFIQVLDVDAPLVRPGNVQAA
ncbi:MAG TPA: hypothetical protein VMZ52_09540 [Bryobacteraceae bacterium]|nr:hypothetical protein [Bryobacteraceae bacterium]